MQYGIEQASFSLVLNTGRVSRLMTARGREFQAASAVQLKDRLPMPVRH